MHMFVGISLKAKKTNFWHFRLKQFDTKSFLAANAQLEKGLIYLTCHDRDKAMEYLQKSL